ncbi:unnamed protein product [Protopolystoma xenopodis]|uniref:Uncharacterized protein n=1 Tax=Protopolystoma xenopodis TaxID=117903 RepID=A0A448WYG9_9PLAT|nr:unnamed protein product [Protopolystoma xenopodis]
MSIYSRSRVSRSALLWLDYAWSHHQFRVPESWYRHQPLARRVASLRLRLFRLKPYLLACHELVGIKTQIEARMADVL